MAADDKTTAASKAADKTAAAKKPTKVRARERGYYNGLVVEEGEVFENTLGLEVYPTDKFAWFEDASKSATEPDEA